MNIDLHHGDCLEILRTIPVASVDAVVTDPPYGLSFMGKKWDYDVPSEDIWRECLRVLKPGGHLLAFAGTRTQHRMAVRIEDAGFEIRDMIAWVYGSGFPKSLNVANAVDEKRKPDTRLELLPDEAKFCAWMREQSGLDTDTVRRITGSARFMTGEVEIVNTATKEKPRMGRRAMVPTAEAWARLREHMALQPPEWVEALVKEPPKPVDETPGEAWTPGKGNGTAGSNEWQGWGTALKPALEPITVARKPLIGTVAENVLSHGTGAINVDGCRVPTDDKLGGGMVSMGRPKASEGWDRPWMHDPEVTKQKKIEAASKVAAAEALGRWPANLIHDGGEEPTDLLGNAARFFYCAKASRADREAGCDGLPQRTAAETVERAEGSAGLDSPRAGAGRTSGARNHHPTVKPTDLMRYLCRLVTPPKGIVLDPFMGSGSTGKAAVLEGFKFIGIEREAEYMDIAKARIEEAKEKINSQSQQIPLPNLGAC